LSSCYRNAILAKLRVIAHELVMSLKSNVTVDWVHREGARAKMRVLVKKILRKYGYPPDLRDAAVQTVLQQAEALSVAAELGMEAKIGCHTFRATGITAYLEGGGTLENAQLMAAHESPRTTKLYDRTGDEITLDEVERITI